MTCSSPNSHLVGLIGSGIRESLTPAMHEREGEFHDMRYVYKRIDFSELDVDSSSLPELLTAAERMSFTGLNITHPCKQEIIQYLDDISDEAASIGAVNTVVLTAKGRVGYNTDGAAFLKSFQLELGQQPTDHIVLFGAGGAGTAIAHVMAGRLAKRLTVFDIRRERARKLVDVLRRKYPGLSVEVGDDKRAAVSVANGVINATPIGMASEPGMVLSPKLLRPTMWVADAIYFPIETELLRIAKTIECPTMNGGRMAVFQAADAFHLFTGVRPDSDRMLQHFDSLVRENRETAQQGVV